MDLPDINIISYSIKSFFVLVCTYYTFIKITNIKDVKIKDILLSSIMIIIIAIISSELKQKYNIYYCIISQLFFVILINKVNFKKDLSYITSITIISLSINYILLAIAIVVSFIPNVILGIKNDYINLLILILIYSLIVYLVSRIKRIKNGFIFLQKKVNDELFNILILNISIVILLIAIVLNEDDKEKNILIAVLIFGILMFITIKKSLELYYKHNLVINELKETKQELEEKKKDIAELEKENLNFSKTSHTLAHRQRMLEFKINQLISNNAENGNILDNNTKESIKTEIEKISEKLYIKPADTEIAKTGVQEIDDMLKYMQSECIKNKIEFELQINGNIYYMINHFISKEELSILIADHVKDAIIAVNYSDNINRNILVKLGEVDDCYGLYIYDSGIEFEQETLENLGKRPITTHADNGGTGMGFMNTFDTLRKHKASLVINELNKPCEDDFTKIIMIRFDEKNEFKIKAPERMK
jgi:hypothetical protein